MTNIAHARPTTGALIAVAPLAGMAAYLLTVALTQTSLTVQDWATYVATGAAAAALAGVAAWLGVRSHDPRRIATTGLALALLGAVTFPVFWLGVIQIFGTTAAAMALTVRPLATRWTGMAAAALVLGALDLVAGTYLLTVG